jgi:GrpB-like predicted nucleotidyltransferase (UPF0157 family)
VSKALRRGVVRKTELCSWTEQWEALYERAEELLHKILKDNVIHMFHIGSTSVHTIQYAKPIIDILVVVSNIERIASYEKEMIQAGYSAKGENGIQESESLRLHGDSEKHCILRFII